MTTCLPVGVAMHNHTLEISTVFGLVLYINLVLVLSASNCYCVVYSAQLV